MKTGIAGDFIWRVERKSREPQTLLATNLFLSERGIGELKQIGYTAQNGQRLKAQLILPFGYEAGRRYPLLTWVYAGLVMGSEPPLEAKVLTGAGPYCLQLAAAQGYAVLFPSMPLPRFFAQQ